MNFEKDIDNYVLACFNKINNFNPLITIANVVNNGAVINVNGVANADNSDLYGRNAAGANATVRIKK